ncbi:golgin subfamily A member 6-like protein 1 isoform X2 [Eriocheir sinensis]|nr:golgin subfamily A member 6-like protein 1 isoform X2 [Eriocheir sinensis]
MMESALEKALSNPGLGVLLLDDTNRALAEDVEQLRQEVAGMDQVWKAENEVHKHNTQRTAEMNQMLQDIQALVVAYSKDIEAEGEQERVTNSEAAGILRQCRKKHSDLATLQEASESLEARAAQSRRETEELEKNLMDDSGLLKELLDHLAEAERDNLLLLQYSAEDASKLKELSVSLEQECMKVAQAEAELSTAQGEVQVAQATLDQLGTAFLQAAADRDHLLAQWEVTLDHIFHKANENTACIEDSMAVQQKVAVLRREVEQETQILLQVKDSCREASENLRVVEEEAQWVAGQLQVTTATREQIQAQVWTMENAIGKISKEIEGLEQRLGEQKNFLEEKKAFLAGLKQQCVKAEEKLALNTELVMSAEETLHSLEALIKEAEGMARGLVKQKERVAEAEQHHRQILSKWQEEEARIKGETAALHSTKARLQTNIKVHEGKIAKQKEIIHDQEADVQRLRRRIHDLTHDSNNNTVEESEQQKHLEVLQQRLQDISHTIKVLTKQLASLKTARFTEQTNVSQLEKQEERIEAELATVRMNSHNAERELARLTSTREEVRVDIGLEQLHLQRRIRQLQATTSQAASLSGQRANMEQVVMEQIHELKTRTGEMERARRTVEGELHQLSLQVHQASSRLLQLRDKYNKIKCSLDSTEGEEVSTTGVFLKVESERAGLQEAGDLLDREVRQAEEEVEALQKMVQLMTIEGQQYRSQLHLIFHHSDEQKEKMELEERLTALQEETLVWEAVLEEEESTLQGTQNKLREIELQVRAVEELLREKNTHLRAVQQETENLTTKSAHATQAANTLLWRARVKSSILSDIELRLGQERLRSVHSLLGEAVSSHPEANQATVIYCQHANIPPPDIHSLMRRESYGSRSSLGTLQSSRSSSSRSSSASSRTQMGSESARSHLSQHSQDSGRSGSPLTRPKSASRPSSSTHLPMPKITLINPAFPPKEQRRAHHYQGKKLYKRPNKHP